MDGVIETMENLEVPTLMSHATRRTLEWCGRLGLRERFGGEMPGSLEDALDAMVGAECPREPDVAGP